MANMEAAMKKAGFQHKPKKGHGHGGPPKKNLPKFPDSYFGTDEQSRRYLQPVFVSRKNVDPLARHLGRDARPKLTTGQMRRFFNHCREIERRLKIDGESWEQVSVGFESLCYHAQNAVSAGKIPQEFQSFINRNVERVTSSDTRSAAFLDGFMPHFEALVGFGAAYLRKDS